jgi:hypothetical protein
MLCLSRSSFLPAPYMHLMFFPSRGTWFCNLCHHVLLTCKSCNTSSSVLSGTSASLGNGMDHDPVSYRSHTIVLLLAISLAFLLPCTARMLDIRSYGVLLSYMWYTKRLLFCPYFCSGLAGTLSSSDTPSAPLWMDISSDIGSPLVVGLLVELLPVSETFFVAMNISNVVAVN